MRQYIGARYVPRFSDVNNGNWSNVYSYEPLTIVKNGNDYYTSKKSVPVGVQITNTEYWVKTGDYNGAISSLDNRLTAAEGDIDTLQTDVNNRQLSLLNRKFLFIGDSYGDQANEWADLVAKKLNLPPGNYSIQCVSGAGFVDHGAGTYKDQLIAYSGNKAEITDIIVCGGINDARYGLSTINTLINAITDFRTYAASNYPYAKISIGFIGSCLKGVSSDYNNFNINNQRFALWAYYNQSSSYFNVMDNVHNAIRTSARDNFLSDGLHPSLLGSVLIAEAVASNILNGSYTVSYPKIADTIEYESAFSESEININYSIVNDITKISITAMTIRPRNVTIGTSYVKVGTLSQICANEALRTSAYFTMQKHGMSGFKNVWFNLVIDGRDIKISQNDLLSDGSAYQSYVFDDDTANNLYPIHDIQIIMPTFDIN